MSDDDHLNILNADQYQNASYFRIGTSSKIDRIPTEIFKIFPELKHFRLSTGIKALNTTSFANARKLEFADLKKNKLKLIPSHVFLKAENLVEIDLSENVIEEIENFSFEYLKMLEIIYLQNNKIKILRRFLFDGATHLKVLQLENNKIETIESGAFDLPELKSLFMAHNKVKSLPDFLFNAALNLYAVDFKSNRLTQISDVFSVCHKLSALILDENQIEDIDLNKLANLPALVQLSLRHSGFRLPADSTVRSQAASISRLTFLDLSENQLDDPNVVRYISNLFDDLEELNLENNLFTHIDGLTKLRQFLPQLKVLHLNGNKFKCSSLYETLTYLRRKKINVPEMHEFDGETKHVDGVTCK